MDKNQKIAVDVLAAVGGKGNVALVTHCMTRLRFDLKDLSIPDREAIQKMDGVVGLVENGGQFQVIIGQNVTKVYDALCGEMGIQTQAAVDDTVNDAGKKKEKLTAKQVGNNILNYLAGSITPAIPAMIAAAMFRTVIVILGPDMMNVIETTDNLYIVCDFMYNAFFYFLPIFVGMNAAKKVNMDPTMGVYAACMLLAPGFMALVGSDISFSVFGIPCTPQNYSQTILPILLIIWVMGYVDKFFKKVIPETLSTVFVPLLTMVVMAPVGLCVLAPLGSVIGNYLGNALVAFGNVGGFLAIAVIAALWEFLVMSGMHAVLGMFAFTMLMQNGSESVIGPAATVATVATAGVAFGAFLRQKNKKEKSASLGYFISSILGGVNEPTLYGIGFKYKRPLVALIIGCFAGGLYAGIMKVDVYAMGMSNILVVVGYIAGGTSNLINGLISCIIAFVVTTAITYFKGFKEEDL